MRLTVKPEDEIDLLELLVHHVEPIIQRAKQGRCTEVGTLKHWMGFMDEYGVRSLADLTYGMQGEYIQWRFERLHAAGFKGSTSTVGREMRVMRAAINSAWKRGILESPKYIQSLPEAPPRSRFMFPEETKRLLKACEQTHHLWLFVMMSLHTLQRPGAIFGLRVEQVRFGEGLIDFLPTGHTQSRKRKPVVPISETLWPLLEQSVEESHSGFIIEFNSLPVNSIRNAFTKACKRAKLEKVTPYTLRHTGATLLLSIGVPIREVSGMLGHTEQQTTERYGKHHPEFLSQARAGVDQLFGWKQEREGKGVDRGFQRRHSDESIDQLMLNR